MCRGRSNFWAESRAQERAAQRSASCLAERPSSEVTAASRRNWRRWFAGTRAMLAVRHNLDEGRVRSRHVERECKSGGRRRSSLDGM